MAALGGAQQHAGSRRLHHDGHHGQSVAPAGKEILADMNLADQALKDLGRVREGLFPSTLSARAVAHAVIGKTDAAVEEAADATANAPDSALVFFRVARVHWMLGEYPAAAEFAAAALSIADPPLPSHLRGEAERLLDSLEDSEATHHAGARGRRWRIGLARTGTPIHRSAGKSMSRRLRA